jgi:8-oxo-dGTP pyrophosphatase MutT (NUDIX family)
MDSPIGGRMLSMTNHTTESFSWQGKVFEFKSEEATLPNGRRATIEVVRHPGSSAIVPVRGDQSVMLLKQYRPAIGRSIWEVPAGTMREGEDPLDCAKRELQEETGFVGHCFEKVGELLTAPGYSDERIHLYLAKDLIPSEQKLDEDECLEIHSFSFEEVMGMINRGEIQDAMSMVALQRVYSRLRENPYVQRGDRKTEPLSVKRLNRILNMLLSDWKDLSDEGRDFPIRWNIMHMYSSSQLAKVLALSRGLNPELAGIAAALHDIGVVATQRHEGHAQAAEKYLDDFIGAYNAKAGIKLAPITRRERDQIVKAVAQHSQKEIDSGDPFVELLKDVDSIDRYLHGVKMEAAHLERFDKVIRELGIGIK